VRIIIVTPEQPAHAKYFCAYLGRRHELVRVIHPAAARLGSRAGVRKARRELARSGVTHSLLRVLATLLNPWILTEAIKKGVGWLALSPPFSARTQRRLREGLNVVYTHYVGEAVPYYADFSVGSTIERFDRDLAALKRHFEFVRVSELVRPSAARDEPSRPLLAFSYPFGVRLAKAAERRLYEDEVFDCAFGIEGFVPRGTPAYRLERACIEGDLAFTVFGTALLGTTRRFLRKGSAAA